MINNEIYKTGEYEDDICIRWCHLSNSILVALKLTYSVNLHCTVAVFYTY